MFSKPKYLRMFSSRIYRWSTVTFEYLRCSRLSQWKILKENNNSFSTSSLLKLKSSLNWLCLRPVPLCARQYWCIKKVQVKWVAKKISAKFSNFPCFSSYWTQFRRLFSICWRSKCYHFYKFVLLVISESWSLP